MPWSAPSADDIAAQFTPAEILLLKTAQGGEENGAAILALVVAEVRDAIRSGSYELDPDEETIPVGLHNDAIAIARWRLLITIPKLKSAQTDERKEAKDRAEKKLELIAAGKRKPDPPAPAADAPPTVSVPKGAWNSQPKLIGRTEPVPRPGQQMPGRYANEDAPADRS